MVVEPETRRVGNYWQEAFSSAPTLFSFICMEHEAAQPVTLINIKLAIS